MFGQARECLGAAPKAQERAGARSVSKKEVSGCYPAPPFMAYGSNEMKRKVAFIYDFDETLCDKDMYEYGVLGDIGLDEPSFRGKVMEFAERESMDRVAAMMYFMLQELKKKGIEPTLDYFQALGKKLGFFPGLEDWFERVNAYAHSKNIELEHYMVTSGTKEAIEKCSLAKHFNQIYGCEFFYRDNVAIAPKLAMNYTAKTQFIFRIHKGIFEPWSEVELNRRTSPADIYMPFENMVYFGDGLTDVACMQIIKARGGYSIGIQNERDMQRGRLLLKDGRVDFLLFADYSAGSEIETTAKKIIAARAAQFDLMELNR